MVDYRSGGGVICREEVSECLWNRCEVVGEVKAKYAPSLDGGYINGIHPSSVYMDSNKYNERIGSV